MKAYVNLNMKTYIFETMFLKIYSPTVFNGFSKNLETCLPSIWILRKAIFKTTSQWLTAYFSWKPLFKIMSYLWLMSYYKDFIRPQRRKNWIAGKWDQKKETYPPMSFCISHRTSNFLYLPCDWFLNRP